MTAQTDKLVLRYTIHDEYLNCYWADGLTCVRCNGKSGVVDKTGNETIPCIYDDVILNDDGSAFVCRYYIRNGCFEVRFNGKYGAVDVAGKILVPLEYDKIHIEQNFIMASKRGRFGILDLDGNPITKVE